MDSVPLFLMEGKLAIVLVDALVKVHFPSNITRGSVAFERLIEQDGELFAFAFDTKPYVRRRSDLKPVIARPTNTQYLGSGTDTWLPFTLIDVRPPAVVNHVMGSSRSR